MQSIFEQYIYDFIVQQAPSPFIFWEAKSYLPADIHTASPLTLTRVEGIGALTVAAGQLAAAACSS